MEFIIVGFGKVWLGWNLFVGRNCVGYFVCYLYFIIYKYGIGFY